MYAWCFGASANKIRVSASNSPMFSMYAVREAYAHTNTHCPRIPADQRNKALCRSQLGASLRRATLWMMNSVPRCLL